MEFVKIKTRAESIYYINKDAIELVCLSSDKKYYMIRTRGGCIDYTKDLGKLKDCLGLEDLPPLSN